MNLLTDELTMSSSHTDLARNAILRDLKGGVKSALTGDLMNTHRAEERLLAICLAFHSHPLGYLSERAQVLIKAAVAHWRGKPYTLSTMEKRLCGFTEGESA